MATISKFNTFQGKMFVLYFVWDKYIYLKYQPFKKVSYKWKNNLGKLFFFDVRFPVVKHGNYYSGAFYILVDDVRYAFVNEFANINSTPLGSATINIELTA